MICSSRSGYSTNIGSAGSAYRCEITFPGTACQGVRLIEGWELKAEGTIQDCFTLSIEAAGGSVDLEPGRGVGNGVDDVIDPTRAHNRLDANRSNGPAIRPAPLVQRHSLRLPDPERNGAAVQLKQRVMIRWPPAANPRIDRRSREGWNLRARVGRLVTVSKEANLADPLLGRIAVVQSQEDFVNPLVDGGR